MNLRIPFRLWYVTATAIDGTSHLQGYLNDAYGKLRTKLQ